jgi:adenosylhomocysteine nucleosidase
LVETGIGANATEKAVAWVFSEPKFGSTSYRPSWLVFAGFAGGLADDLSVGDLVLGTEVVASDGQRLPTTWPPKIQHQSWLRRGAILSAPRLVVDPDEKGRLGQTHKALAVDMESAAFARLCSQRGVPFGCLRVISDDIHTPLAPELVALFADGRISWSRILLALARRPSLVGEFRRLARATHVAANRLAEALRLLLSSGQ